MIYNRSFDHNKNIHYTITEEVLVTSSYRNNDGYLDKIHSLEMCM